MPVIYDPEYVTRELVHCQGGVPHQVIFAVGYKVPWSGKYLRAEVNSEHPGPSLYRKLFRHNRRCSNAGKFIPRGRFMC